MKLSDIKGMSLTTFRLEKDSNRFALEVKDKEEKEYVFEFSGVTELSITGEMDDVNEYLALIESPNHVRLLFHGNEKFVEFEFDYTSYLIHTKKED